MAYEVRRCTRPDITQEIAETLGGITLPAGPSGMVGLEREYRRYFTSAEPGRVAKLLYRGMQSPEHRENAIWYVNNQTKEELGLVARELEYLRKVAALPLPTRATKAPKVVVNLSIETRQLEWLRGLGPNLSANVREVLNAAMGVES